MVQIPKPIQREDGTWAVEHEIGRDGKLTGEFDVLAEGLTEDQAFDLAAEAVEVMENAEL